MSLRRNPLLLFVVALSAALLLPALFMDGMFMDGLIYTCVGKNLANGQGTFWDPYFSATYMTSYHEQPPLMYALEAVFFKVLGNSLYTERMYCLFFAIACFFSLRFIWTALFANEKENLPVFWLPVLFFFISPVTFWAYTHNVEEATMVVFALLAAGFQLRGIQSENYGPGWFALAGIALIASSMCKGMQGLFPLVIPAVWWLCVRNISFRKAFFASVIVVGIPLVFYAMIALYEPAKNSYLHYFHDRLYRTFNVATVATSSSRFFILFELLLDLLPALFIGVILLLVARGKIAPYKRQALALFVTGMAGILPLMVTMEQRGFYLVTGLPFITTSMALLCLDGARKLHSVVDQRARLRIFLSGLGLLVLAGTFTATFYLAGKPKRDADMIRDVHLIAQKTGDGTIISAEESAWNTWSLQGYFVRYHSISLTNSDTTARFFVVPADEQPPKGYFRVTNNTRSFHLYSR